jgi:alkanesulfonate monooxygenase SsuD/methylene tetrahydromethanopterin reductase-like flavin-dependent oxidoreductase (luciferase family)
VLARHAELAEAIGFDSVWVIDSQLLCREITVTLAELSNGRAVMGVGTGFSSLRTIGMPAAESAEVESFVTTVRALLNQEDVSFGTTRGSLAWLPGALQGFHHNRRDRPQDDPHRRADCRRGDPASRRIARPDRARAGVARQ